ncbi:MAG TPA: MFS transporter [Caulobacteraceae bacterium]|nr:MFS transporter [Caulobacteraceae bacterium]
MPVGERPALGLTTKLLYGVGAMGGSVKGRLSQFLLFFYQVLNGVPPLWISAALSVSLLIDALWDPVVGQLSDNTRTPWGRRHPYIYGAAPPAALCFVLLFMPPHGSPAQMALWMFVFIVGTRLFDSLNEIPASALMPELTQNYDERTTVQSYRYLFGNVIGGLVGTALAFVVFLRATKTEHFGQYNRAGYLPFAITSALIGLAVVYITALATQRFIPYMHQPPRQRASIWTLIKVMASALGNRNFAAIAISGLIFGIAVGIAGGLGVYFSTFVFQLGSPELAVVGFSLVPASLIGVVLAPIIGRVLDKKRACITVFFIAIASTTIPLGAWLLGLMPAGAPWVLPVIVLDNMATTALATTGFIIVSSMIADVVDDNQVRSGRRSEGLLYAAESLLRKVTTSFAALIPGVVLTIVHFPSHVRPGHVDPAILHNLVVLYLPTYTVLTLCSTSMLFLYRINRGQHLRTLETLGEAAAAAETVEEELGMAEPIVTRSA